MDEKTLLKIDGIVMPTPSKFVVTLNDLDTQETGRSLDGNMHRDVIGFNFRTIDLEWNVMSRENLKTFLSIISKPSFTVVYYDPIQDALVEKTMYAGNRKVDMYNYIIDNGKPIWTNISVTLIQTNNIKTEPDRLA